MSDPIETQEASAVRPWAEGDPPLPALYLGHGAPPLLDDERWTSQLAAWARKLPRPTAILIVSAHWESAPLTIGATETGTPLTYDFYGFPRRFYELTYASPGAPDLAARVKAMVRDTEPVAEEPGYGLDHGAFVPLLVMYPEADVPVLQISMPSLDPQRLFDLGRRLRDLRNQGVLVVGSGFLTHGLPFLRDWQPEATPPGWSKEFDDWAKEAFARGDVDELMAFASRAPGMPYAHPTVEHFAPLFVTLGAASDPERTPWTEIEGFFLGLAKRSVQFV